MEDERAAQASYWRKHSQQATCESMMLDSRAQELDQHDRPEVLRALGSVQGKTVLELGAGIGRFTGELAQNAAHVTANDFMPSLIEENRKTNGSRGNVTFITQDATTLNYDELSVDVVFSNWLLMYLSDEEMEKLIQKILRWLREGGVFFFRESCYRPAGDFKRSENPTHYRDVISYFAVLDRVFYRSNNGKYFKFKLINCSNCATYARVKRNCGQIYWKLVKVEKEPDQVEFRHFLDHVQYTRNGILRYEKLFGFGFISTGGMETTSAIIGCLDLKPHQLVLDVGCGVGGADFYMARNFGVDVLGIDLSVNMVAIALERACKGEYDAGEGVVTLEVADCTTRDFEPGTFDVIYSRDSLLHIHEKPRLFRRMYDWLKPGGKLFITDYCKSDGKPSEEFVAYIKQRGYDLHSVHAYGEMLMEAGFEDVDAQDVTESMFLPALHRELKVAEDTREAFLKEFSREDYDAVVNGWNDKVTRASGGEQRWGKFFGRKPTPL